MNRAARRAIALAVVQLTLTAGACSDSPDSPSQPAHPALECGGERSGTGNYDLVGPGLETVAAALNDRLSYFQRLYGGEIVELPDNEAALVVDGSKVVVATARALPEGGFLVQEDYSCNSFQPQQDGAPSTTPHATTSG